jgi:hypothetical protein
VFASFGIKHCQNLANHFQAQAQDLMAKAAAAEVRDKTRPTSDFLARPNAKG